MNPAAHRPLRVVVYGPESTGKSTLAERLAARFTAPWSPEYVRDYWDAHGGIITSADLDAIARGQRTTEDAARARAEEEGGRVAFHDTDLLTCTVWDDLLFPSACPDWLRGEADARARATDLFLFCDTDLPWVPDPQRCFPDEAGREMCRKLFLDKLEATGARWTRIHGADATREALAVAAVELLLNRCSSR
jgi:NadR type nicotinamide-nucleotide adenylyltransferase